MHPAPAFLMKIFLTPPRFFRWVSEPVIDKAFAFEELEEGYEYFGRQKVRSGRSSARTQRTPGWDLETDFQNPNLKHVGRVIIKIA